MAERSVEGHLASVTPTKRRRDAETLLTMMRRITGEEPVMWHTVVGFGRYHYHYASGREGDAPAAAFAPRRVASVVYLADGVDRYAESLERLGPHKVGVGCVYVRDLDEVDLAVLEEIVTASYARLTAGTYEQRARDSGSA
jgi:hypothetical protein